MGNELIYSIIRIVNSKNHPEGAGFIVINNNFALSCAHVVTSALGLPGIPFEKPEGLLMCDFPLLEPNHLFPGQIVFWNAEKDVCAIHLDETSTCAKPVFLLHSDDVWGHPFQAFGFPSGLDDGVWASGILRRQQAAHWVQIEGIEQTGYSVSKGFSGTPVWDDQLDAVVGMIVAADTHSQYKSAYMIPTQELISTWSNLLPFSIDANSLEYLKTRVAHLVKVQEISAEPQRFQAIISDLRESILGWGDRISDQKLRIESGLDTQYKQITESNHKVYSRKVTVIGQRPQGIVDHFKDRIQEQNTIKHLLTDPSTKLISVIGQGGMGKTALASKVLNDLERHQWPSSDDNQPVDGIVYFSTRTTGISLERVFLDCAKLLGKELEKSLYTVWTDSQLSLDEKISRLLETLTTGKYVILLDNIEDLLDDKGRFFSHELQNFFDRFLFFPNGARLIITSRVPLAFGFEVKRFDHQVKLLDGLPIEEGVILLRELDPNGECGLRDLSNEELAKAVTLVHGVPRALEIMAGILANDPFLSLSDVVQQFFHSKDVISKLVEENFKQLDQNSRRVMEALSIFHRPVPPIAVDFLLEPFSPGIDVPNIIRRLSLVNIVNVDRNTKLVTLHPIDQDFSYCMIPDGESGLNLYNRKSLERRAADYYRRLRLPQSAWKTIDDLSPQLSEFQHLIKADDFETAALVLSPIDFDYLSVWGYYDRLIEMRSSLNDNLTSPSLQAENIGRIGNLYHLMGQFSRAVNPYQKALDISRMIGDQEQEGNWLGHLGTASHLGQYDKAIDYYQKALAIARDIGDKRNETIWLNRLGLIYHFYGRFDQALQLYEQGLSLALEMKNLRSEELQIGYMGQTMLSLGQTDKAIELLNRALDLTREIGFRRHEIAWLNSLGISHLLLGQISRARFYHDEAINIAREIHDTRAYSFGLLGLTRCLIELGDLIYAERCCQEAIDLDIYETGYQAAILLGCILYKNKSAGAAGAFLKAIKLCEEALATTAGVYEPQFALAAGYMGLCICDPSWNQLGQRPALIKNSLQHYLNALAICSAPGVLKMALIILDYFDIRKVPEAEPLFDEFNKYINLPG